MGEAEIKRIAKIKKGDTFETLYDRFGSFNIKEQRYIVADHIPSLGLLLLKKPASTLFGFTIKWDYRYIRYKEDGPIKFNGLEKDWLELFFEYYLYEDAI
jgi:hypothetical protein